MDANFPESYKNAHGMGRNYDAPNLKMYVYGVKFDVNCVYTI